MPSRLAAAACAIALLALCGCSYLQPLPPPAGTNAAGAPAGRPSPADQVLLQRALDEGSTDASGAPEFETRVLLDVAAAKRSFPDARFPRFALGRKMVGMVYKVAVKDDVEPRSVLTLVYEDQLIVAESIYSKPPSFGAEPGASVLTTDVGGASASVTEYETGLAGTARHARVRWPIDDLTYVIVDTPDASSDQVLQIARSVVP